MTEKREGESDSEESYYKKKRSDIQDNHATIVTHKAI